MKFVIPVVWALTMTAARFADPLAVILIVSVTMAAIVAWRERTRMRELMRVTPRTAALAAAAAAVMVAVTYLAFPLLVRRIPSIGMESHAIFARFLAQRSVAMILLAVIPVIVAEEVLWRGEFQQSLGKWGVLVTASTYAIAHAPLGSLLLVAVAFLCGLYWSALRAMSGSLIPSLCAHAAWDVALIVLPLVAARA
ncbi:MAG: CPBP family intramembrane glutamic endopeptidase [Thermoanaerobaculia bacterium]